MRDVSSLKLTAVVDAWHPEGYTGRNPSVTFTVNIQERTRQEQLSFPFFITVLLWILEQVLLLGIHDILLPFQCHLHSFTTTLLLKIVSKWDVKKTSVGSLAGQLRSSQVLLRFLQLAPSTLVRESPTMFLEFVSIFFCALFSWLGQFCNHGLRLAIGFKLSSSCSVRSSFPKDLLHSFFGVILVSRHSWRGCSTEGRSKSSSPGVFMVLFRRYSDPSQRNWIAGCARV